MPADTYRTDEVALRVVGNNLLVHMDSRPRESAGGILFPGDAAEHAYNTAVVVAVGYLTGSRAAYHTPIPGIKQGDRVLVVRYQSDVDSNKYMQRVAPGIVRIRAADVILVLDSDDLDRVR